MIRFFSICLRPLLTVTVRQHVFLSGCRGSWRIERRVTGTYPHRTTSIAGTGLEAGSTIPRWPGGRERGESPDAPSPRVLVSKSLSHGGLSRSGPAVHHQIMSGDVPGCIGRQEHHSGGHL